MTTRVKKTTGRAAVTTHRTAAVKKTAAPKTATPKAAAAPKAAVTPKPAAAPKTITATLRTTEKAPRLAAVPPPPVAEWARNQKKVALSLVDSLEDRGLLDQEEVTRLKSQLDEIATEKSPADALAGFGQFQKRVTGCLSLESPRPAADRSKALENLFEINRQIARLIDPVECCDRLLGLINQVIPSEGATLYLAEPDGGRLQVAATTGPETDLIDRIEFDRGTGFSGWVARTQKPILFGSLKKSQPTHRGVIKSFMAAPLVVAGETIGVLTLGHSQEGAFTREDLRLLVMIGTQAAALVQKVALEARIRAASITDATTGLYNTAHFMLRMQDEVARAGRFMQEFSVVRLALDDFAAYREAVGKETADRAVHELASVLQSLARSTDLLARTADAEFAILMPATSREEARSAAGRLARAIESHVLPRRKRLAAATGLATFPEQSAEPQELMHLADKALECARRESRHDQMAVPAASA